jgi:hypothetical protein
MLCRERRLRIVITRWGLDAYLELLHKGVFDRALYRKELRPDILKLRAWPHDDAFQHAKFWGPADDGSVVPDGYKMKWHNFGNGNVQLRLCVGLVGGDAYLCHAFVKTSPDQDKREAAKLRKRISLIRDGNFDWRGEL